MSESRCSFAVHNHTIATEFKDPVMAVNSTFTAVILLFILLFSALTPSEVLASKKHLRFQNLSINDGLSQSSILCMLQDSQGFLWFGTYDGLNRYDGIKMKIYGNRKDNKQLSDNNIRAIYEDSAGIMWVGTKDGGLNRYNRLLDTFTSFVPDKNDPDSISGRYVQCIYEDSRGNLWIGTDKGLNLFSRENKKFQSYRHSESKTDSINSDDVRAICEDNSGNLWIGTATGISRFDRRKQKFTKYFDQSPSSTLGDNAVLTLFAAKDGLLWVGTENSLKVFNPELKTFKTCLNGLEINHIYKDRSGNFWIGTSKGLAYPKNSNKTNTLSAKSEFEFIRHEPSNPQGLNSNQITRIMEDSSGVLWVGTYTDGVCKATPKMRNFMLLQHLDGIKNSLSGNEVSAVLEDNDGLIWIGTYTEGIDIYNPETGEIMPVNTKSAGPWKIPSNAINCLFQDSKNHIWTGTRDKGVFVLDKEKGLIANYINDPEDESTLSHNIVWWIYEGSKGYIWIGTSKKGLNRLDPETGEIRHYRHDKKNPRSIAHDRVRNIFEDSRGNLWIGTNGGLDLMDRTAETFKHHQNNPADPDSISNNLVTPIAEAADGTLWIGTDKGINHFYPESGKFKRYTIESGLINDVIQGLAIDAKGNVWASSFKGISKIESATDEITNYGTYDGLQRADFWTNAYTKGASGRLYFGGLKGLNYFYPQDITKDDTIPTVVITGISVMNSPLKLKTNVVNTREITLSYKDVMFSISFAALDYQNPEHIRYKYKLAGFDEHWIESSYTHKATFTNFDQGTYVFKVRACNSDGVWNEKGTELKIIITPPFWKTWWFYSLIAVAAVLLLLLFIRLKVRVITKQKQKLSEEVKARTAELKKEIENHRKTEIQLEKAIVKAEEANKAKSSFLANMSHEIRTPLNSIIGMADLLRDTGLDSEQREYVNIFKSSGEILLSIINDILDFSKIEAGYIKLEQIPIDLFQEVESVMTLQAVASSSRQVELICRFGADVPEFVIGDPTRLRQILLNIISNATKFTPKGEVSLYVTREPDAESADMLCFTIHDTGIGIEQDKIKNIFTPFSQAKSSTTRKFGGSGLGLSISKSLTELMGGRIKAESSPGHGSTFIVEIPLPRDPESESLLAPDFSGKTILVAVNNETLAETLTELVELYGAETICSTSAVEFKSELEIERRKPIDAIIVDQEIDETDSVFILESQLGKNSINAPKSILLTRGLSSKKRIQGLEYLIPASCPKPVPRRLLLRQLIDIIHGDEGSEINSKDETEILPDLKILVAENDIPSRELIRHFLKPYGTTIVMSSDGKEALKLALNNDFDLVMLEMEIPSMDGSSFLGRLRSEEKAKKKSRLPVLAFSAYPSADSREKSMDAGADSFISKPMDKNQLIREIKKLTRK